MCQPISGQDSPEFEKLLDFLKKNRGKVDYLLFIRWDRFSRNTGDSYSMINTLHRLGVEPKGIEQSLDLSIPENKMMLAFYLSAPEVENDRRAINTFTGMRRAKKEGRWVSAAPRGYKNVRNETGMPIIVPNEDADTIRWSFEEIAKGVHTVIDVFLMAKEKGLKCCKNNFWLFIRNPIYCGKILVPAYREEDAYYVKGIHEPLISEELFQQVQDVLNGRKRNTPSKNTRKEELPLRGFLICPKCKGNLTGSASNGNGGKYFYYHCTPECGERFRADSANDEFLKFLRKINFYQQGENLYSIVVEKIFTLNEKERIEKMKKNSEDHEKLRNRLNKAQQLMLDGALEASDYKEIKKQLEPEIDKLVRERMQLSLMDSDFKNYLKTGYTIIKNMDFYYEKSRVGDKQRLVGLIFPEKVVFEKNNYRTNSINKAISLICLNSAELMGDKKEKGSEIAPQSSMVPGTGLEPAQFAPLPPQSSASTNFATRANNGRKDNIFASIHPQFFMKSVNFFHPIFVL